VQVVSDAAGLQVRALVARVIAPPILASSSTPRVSAPDIRPNPASGPLQVAGPPSFAGFSQSFTFKQDGGRKSSELRVASLSVLEGLTREMRAPSYFAECPFAPRKQ